MITILDKVIDQVNLLWKYQPELLVLTDWKGQIIGDGDGDLTGVDGGGDENEVPQKF